MEKTKTERTKKTPEERKKKIAVSSPTDRNKKLTG
jgi:hypothetical protein